MTNIAPILQDIVGCVGAATLLYGVSLISVPVALIIAGGALMGVAFLWAHRG